MDNSYHCDNCGLEVKSYAADTARASEARLREALEESLCYCSQYPEPGSPVNDKGVCDRCTALSDSSGEWLELKMAEAVTNYIDGNQQTCDNCGNVYISVKGTSDAVCSDPSDMEGESLCAKCWRAELADTLARAEKAEAERDALLGNPKAVHQGALAAIEAMKQMQGNAEKIQALQNEAATAGIRLAMVEAERDEWYESYRTSLSDIESALGLDNTGSIGSGIIQAIKGLEAERDGLAQELAQLRGVTHDA